MLAQLASESQHVPSEVTVIVLRRVSEAERKPILQRNIQGREDTPEGIVLDSGGPVIQERNDNIVPCFVFATAHLLRLRFIANNQGCFQREQR